MSPHAASAPSPAAASLARAFAVVPLVLLRHGQPVPAAEDSQAPAPPGSLASPTPTGQPAQAGPRRGALEAPSPGGTTAALRAAGATWIQVVDVDAALGERNQWPALARLLDGRIRIQFGGGLRSMTQIQQVLDLGAERVVVGTQAVRNPLWARELARIFPGRVAIAFDVAPGGLVVQGRKETAGPALADLARSLDDAGLAAFVCTWTDGPLDRAAVAALRLAAPRTPLFVGGALSPEDVEWLHEAGAAGAVVEWPLGGAELAQALRRHPPPVVAPILQVLHGREEAEEAWDGDAGSPGEPETDEPADLDGGEE